MTGGNDLKKQKNDVRSVGSLLASSAILSALGRLSALIYRKLGSGLFGGMFGSYRGANDAAARSEGAQKLRQSGLNDRVFVPIKRQIARQIENSAILGWIRDRLTHMLTSSMKAYGIFMFSATLYSALAYLFRVFYFSETGSYESAFESIEASVVLTLIAMLVASVMMVASRHTLAGALTSSPAARFILFEIVGIRRETLENLEMRDSRFNVAFIAGLIFGIASSLIGPLTVLILIAGLIAAFLVLISPEFGVVAIVTVLPFAPTMGLVAAVLYTALCFFFKVMCGRRSIKFDLLDGVIFIFMLLMIGGGLVAVNRASAKPMLVYAAFMAGYFLVVNLIRSKEWLMRCLVGVIGSCTLVGLYGLFQNFFGTVEQTWQDSDMFSEIEGRVVSTFENPNVLAEYLIMVLPLIFAMFLISGSGRVKLSMVLAGGIVGGCLIYTWSRGAWLGFLIGIMIFLLMFSKHTMTVLLFGSLGIPFLPFILPESITQRFLSIGNLGDSSTSYRVNIWRGVGGMLKDYWATGIGIGTDSFREVYPLYSLSGIESAPHSHNLYLQILTEIGVVGLVVFLAVLFIYAQSCFSLHMTEKRREKLVSAAIFCGMLSVLAQGMTDYIWYNYRVFLMFWLMLGLGAASRRILTATAEAEEYEKGE
ncbi:MAG: hypothetical protein E7632_04335 [Ruminococcaceae bacterium]|nr:hypothetical protein [Oscillospiraceae bacterium]